jgi:hypothetical protein
VGDLEAQVKAFTLDYNQRHYQESIGDLTPADVYFGRGQTILLQRERIKRRPSPNAAAPTASRVMSSTQGARASLNWHRSLSDDAHSKV